MGPPALAGDEVLKAVAVDVGDAKAMRLRETAVNLVPTPAVLGLLIPPDTKIMGTAGKNVVVRLD